MEVTIYGFVDETSGGRINLRFDGGPRPGYEQRLEGYTKTAALEPGMLVVQTGGGSEPPFRFNLDDTQVQALKRGEAVKARHQPNLLR